MSPQSFLLRGDEASIPEPEVIVNGEDSPLDHGGINLWVRHRMNGTDFCDWQKAAKLKLGAQWAA